MTQPKKQPNSTLDDQLAEFTDQVMDGKLQQAASNADDELLGLEKTVLRLKSAIPPISMDDQTVRQMQSRLNARIKREAVGGKQPFWKEWFTPNIHRRARPQFAMAFAAIALMVLLVFVFPSLTTSGSSTTATALNASQNFFVIMALAGVILIMLWITRRK